MTGYATGYDLNSSNSWCWSRVASNSLTVEAWDLITESSGFAALATANSRFSWVAITNKTYDDDNQTVAKDKVLFRPAAEWSTWEIPTDWDIAQSDVGKYYTITSDQLVDQSTGSATKTSNLNLKLVEYKAARLWVFEIDNDIVD